MGQHGIKVGEQSCQELALAAAVRHLHDVLGKDVAVEQKKYGEDRHEQKPDNVDGELGSESAHVLRPGNDLPAMPGEPLLHVLLGVVAPALLGADLPGNLAAGKL